MPATTHTLPHRHTPTLLLRTQAHCLNTPMRLQHTSSDIFRPSLPQTPTVLPAVSSTICVRGIGLTPLKDKTFDAIGEMDALPHRGFCRQTSGRLRHAYGTHRRSLRPRQAAGLRHLHPCLRFLYRASPRRRIRHRHLPTTCLAPAFLPRHLSTYAARLVAVSPPPAHLHKRGSLVLNAPCDAGCQRDLLRDTVYVVRLIGNQRPVKQRTANLTQWRITDVSCEAYRASRIAAGGVYLKPQWQAATARAEDVSSRWQDLRSVGR